MPASLAGRLIDSCPPPPPTPAAETVGRGGGLSSFRGCSERSSGTIRPGADEVAKGELHPGYFELIPTPRHSGRGVGFPLL